MLRTLTIAALALGFVAPAVASTGVYKCVVKTNFKVGNDGRRASTDQPIQTAGERSAPSVNRVRMTTKSRSSAGGSPALAIASSAYPAGQSTGAVTT